MEMDCETLSPLRAIFLDKAFVGVGGTSTGTFMTGDSQTFLLYHGCGKKTLTAI